MTPPVRRFFITAARRASIVLGCATRPMLRVDPNQVNRNIGHKNNFFTDGKGKRVSVKYLVAGILK